MCICLDSLVMEEKAQSEGSMDGKGKKVFVLELKETKPNTKNTMK